MFFCFPVLRLGFVNWENCCLRSKTQNGKKVRIIGVLLLQQNPKWQKGISVIQILINKF